MWSFLKRAFVLLLAFALIAIFIWFAGPYPGFGNYRPLETENARLIAIALVPVCWLLVVLYKRLRAIRAGDRLVGAVIRQAPREKERPSAEAASFAEAMAALKQQGRSGNLYELPWYVFIGAPGSGKTTALLNSGLRFPLEQRVGRAAVRGVGGTRNCDWWFTDEAVFLDTAGRYTTQDSDATSDRQGWQEFLRLLGTHRKRRPLNGIVLTISAQDLLTQGEADREVHVEAARRRLNELTSELHIQLPVYLMVTKCDMVAGFTEYFDDLSQESRKQVWGVTFPYERTLDGDAPDAFGPEFDALVARLNGRLLARVEDERNGRRRATVFAFPQQMAALRDLLTQFVSEVFTASRLDPQILLRGVYFTSGTQDGTQIDRLLGAIGRGLGFAPEAVAPPPGRGKAYFVERLLKTVIIGESGLAGVNRRLEFQQVARQIGAYAGAAVLIVAGLVALSVSYARNRAYLDQVAVEVAPLRGQRPAATTASLEAFLPYLNALRAVSDSANRYQDARPWAMRWGLYQGSSVGNAAHDAYLRELDSIVLPRFAARLRQHVIGSASDPEKLFDYLKGYLMLGDPHHFDRAFLQRLADQEWRPESAPNARPSLSSHVRTLLERGDTLRPVALDPALVARARSSIRQASIPQIMYGQLQRRYNADVAGAPRLDMIAGVGIEKVFRGRTRPLSAPIPAFYTQKVFKEVTGTGMLAMAKAFADDEWVWGTGAVSVATLPQLIGQVTDLYERDYNRIWDGILNDIEVVGFANVRDYSEALGIIVGPSSPFRGILRAAVDNTSLVAPPPDAAVTTGAPSIGTRITEGAKDLFNKAQQKITGNSNAAPGTLITEHFQPLHRFMAGAPAPIDGIIGQLGKIRDQLEKLGPQVGGESTLKALADPAVLDLLRELRQSASDLPAPAKLLVMQIAADTGTTIAGAAKTELDQLYRQEIVAACRARVEGRYPFGTGADLSLADFGDLFGYGGLYDKFFNDEVDKLVDRSQDQWRWREGVVPSGGLLDQFQRAKRIRELFFSPGAKQPKLNFQVMLSNLDPSAKRFYVSLDGIGYEIAPGATSRAPAVWPGEKPGATYAALEDRTAPADYVRVAGGPWAWFRFIDMTLAHPPGQPESGLASVLAIKSKYHSAWITIIAPSAASNPFADSTWRQFTCQP